MELLITLIGVLLLFAGIVGCIVPFIPGPPLCLAALLIQQFHNHPPFSTTFLVMWAVIVAVVTLLDYLIPLFGTGYFGGTKYGVWGSALGLVVGLWFGPLGVIVGLLLGAFAGEVLAHRDTELAVRAALGSFIGFVLGSGIKLLASFVMTYYFVRMVLL